MKTIVAKNKEIIDNTNSNTIVIGNNKEERNLKFIIPNLMQFDSNYIIFDNDYTLLKQVGSHFEENGYMVKVLNLIDPIHSYAYNPFTYFNNDDDVLEFAKMTIKSFSILPDIQLAASSLISALSLYLIKYRPKQEQNLLSILKLLRAAERINRRTQNIKSPLDRIFDEVQKRDSGNISVKQYMIFKDCDTDIQNKTVQILKHNLSIFETNKVKNLIDSSNDSFYRHDFRFLDNNLKSVYFVLLPFDEQYNFLTKVFYNNFINYLFKSNEGIMANKLPQHLKFIFNDINNLPNIDKLEQIINVGYQYNISTTICSNNFSLLQEKVNNDLIKIYNNFPTYILLDQLDMYNANIIEPKLNKNNVSINDVLSLDINKCVVIHKNMTGIFYKNKSFKPTTIYDVNSKFNLNICNNNIKDIDIQMSNALKNNFPLISRKEIILRMSK